MVDDPPFRTPVLSFIFYGFGGLLLLGTAWLVRLAVSTLVSNNHPVSTTGMPGWLSCAGMLFAALVCFGVGQLVAYAGRIARYAALIHDSLERGESIRPRRAQDMYAIFKGVADNGARSLASQPTHLSASGDATQNYFLNPEGQAKGPLTLDELKRLAAGGSIGPDTLVFLEGEEDWQPLAAKVTL